MTSDELVELLAERPFLPLRIHLSNGRTHELRHPEMAIVGQDVVALGVQRAGEEFPRIRLVDIRHINEIEPAPRSVDPSGEG